MDEKESFIVAYANLMVEVVRLTNLLDDSSVTLSLAECEETERHKENLLREVGRALPGQPRKCEIPLDEPDRLLAQALEVEKRLNQGSIISLGRSEWTDVRLINFSAEIMDVIGCLTMRDHLRGLAFRTMTNKFFNPITELGQKKRAISEDRCFAKKGKRNKHYDEVLKIAGDTWAKYPNASLKGLSEDIRVYLKTEWRDAPVADTIYGWLKDSGQNPDVKPKNRNYTLVTKGG